MTSVVRLMDPIKRLLGYLDSFVHLRRLEIANSRISGKFSEIFVPEVRRPEADEPEAKVGMRVATRTCAILSTST